MIPPFSVCDRCGALRDARNLATDRCAGWVRRKDTVVHGGWDICGGTHRSPSSQLKLALEAAYLLGGWTAARHAVRAKKAGP